MKHHVQRVVDHLYGPTGSIILHIIIVIALVKFVAFSKEGEKPEVEVMMMDPEAIDLEELEEIKKELEEIEPPEVQVEVNVEQPPTPDEVENFDNPDPEVDLAALDISDATSPLVMRGLFSGRSAAGRAHSLKAYGGSGATEAAVMNALRWLKKHQKEDGSWDNKKVAFTGLALLAFLAHGETPSSKEFGTTVEKAIKFLVKSQKDTGMFSSVSQHGVYEHAIATYAVSEAYGMTHIPTLKKAMDAGILKIVEGQQPGGGWDYAYRQADRRDTSVSGWHVQAMKAAYLSGCEAEGIKECMKRSIQDMKSVHHPEKGTFAYSNGRGGSLAMTGAGVLALQFLGQGKSPEVKRGIEALEKTHPGWKEHNTSMYGWYYITQAKFHKGGETWKRWNKKFSATLVNNQAKDGHWDAPGKEHGSHPVYCTALGALMLQVYYRNLPTFKEKASEAEEEPVPDINDGDVKIEII